MSNRGASLINKDGVPVVTTQGAGAGGISTAVSGVETYLIDGSTDTSLGTSEGVLVTPRGSLQHIPYAALTDPDGISQPLLSPLNAYQVSRANPAG